MHHVRFFYKGRWFDHEVYITPVNRDDNWLLVWLVDAEMWKFVDASKVEVWLP